MEENEMTERVEGVRHVLGMRFGVQIPSGFADGVGNHLVHLLRPMADDRHKPHSFAQPQHWGQEILNDLRGLTGCRSLSVEVSV
jgi:hypothetical protein